MYDRAVRFQDDGSINTGSTGVNVGPGSYRVESLRPSSEGFAPFLSLDERYSLFTRRKDDISPGPGSYEAKLIHDHVKGGSSVGNRMKRFNEPVNQTPGPGKYEVSIPKPSTAIEKRNDNQKPLMNVIVRSSAPPSIPSPGQAYGYEEGRDGVLRKQKVPDTDKSLGPAFYALNFSETAPVQKYKGVHFGSLTEKRIVEPLKQGKGNPGPGAYTISDISKINPMDFGGQSKKQVEANIPRYHEIVTNVEKKKDVPGPGKYESKSQFDNKETMYDKKLRPSFGSQSQRFVQGDKDKSPGPDTYYDRRHALDRCDKLCGLKQSPFGLTAKRFQHEPSIRKTPAPDSYNIKGLTDVLERKAYQASNLKGAFGSSSVRTFPFTNNNEDRLPGPSHYSVDKTYVPQMPTKHAVFKSSTHRITGPNISVPSPGSYNIVRDFDDGNNNRALCKVPGKPVDGGFLSSTKRFSQPRDIIIKKTDVSTPGPGDYEVKAPDAPGISMKTNIDRFKDVENEVPGPGTYQLSPLIQNSVLRGTFNVTLNNPVGTTLSRMGNTSSQLSLKVG